MTFQRAARLAAATLALASLTVAHAEGSLSVDVKAQMPVSCEASVVASQVVSITPLLINATIRENCNTRHDLSFIYDPRHVIRPSRLFVTYDGKAPDVRTTGAETFTNLPHRNVTKPLTISYSGGTTLQRQALAQTWRISVTVR